MGIIINDDFNVMILTSQSAPSSFNSFNFFRATNLTLYIIELFMSAVSADIRSYRNFFDYHPVPLVRGILAPRLIVMAPGGFGSLA